MRIGTLRRGRALDTGPGVSGTVRLDRRTKNLPKRLQPGDIAVIDHVDLDRVSAEALVTGGVVAVINASSSISGRYPNLGPEILISAGVALIDGTGDEIFTEVAEGESLHIEDDIVYAGERVVAKGTLQTVETVAAATAEARAGLAVQLE